MKHTLSSRHGDRIARFMTDGAIDPSQYRNILATLHTEAVQQTIEHLEPNPLLNERPPPISPSETTNSSPTNHPGPVEVWPMPPAE